MADVTFRDAARAFSKQGGFSHIAHRYNLGGPALTNKTPTQLLRDAAPTNSFGQPSSAGVPWFNLVFPDPTTIEAIITPCKVAEIVGERVLGNWAQLQAGFKQVSPSYDHDFYGDFNQSGDADSENTYFYRDNILLQIWKKIGDLEQAQYAEGRIDKAAEINRAAILGLKKAANQILAFGVEGKKTYGFLNDPNLQEAVQPYVKTDMNGKSLGTTAWLKTQDPRQIYCDIKDKLVQELINRSEAILDMESEMTLVYPNEVSSALAATNDFGLTVKQLCQQTMPNLKFKSLPEAGVKFSGGKSNINQIVLYADRLNGEKVVEGATSTALRAGRVEEYSTNARQKLINSSYGVIWYQPAGQVTMVGV